MVPTRPTLRVRLTRSALAASAALVLLGIIGIIGVAGPAGCASSSKKTDQAATPAPLPKFPALDDAWRAAGYKLDWVGYPFVGIERTDAIRGLSIHDDVIVAQESGSTVTAMEAKNGAVRWSSELTNPLTRFVGLTRSPVNPGVVMASSESEVFSLDLKTGSLVGREKLGKVANTAPITDGPLLVFGTAGGEIMAHRTGTGLRAWGFKATGDITANPVRVGSAAGFASQAGDVVFVDTKTGTLVGRGQMFGGLVNNPVAAGETMITAGLDQSVYCFAPSGAQRWRYRTPVPLKRQPLAAGGMVFIDVPGDGLTALDASTGSVRWKNAKTSGDALNWTKGKLLVREGSTITILETARGATVQTVQIPGVTRLFAEKPEGGKLFATTDTNLVAALTPLAN